MGDTEITEYNYNGYGQLENIYHGSDIGGTITSNKIREYDYLTTGQLNKTIDYLKFDEANTTQTMSTIYDYTDLGYVKEIKYTNDTASITMEKYNYTYDKNGNIKTETTQSIDNITYTKTYDYDPMGRLESSTFENNRWDYFYDKVGNKTSEEYYTNGAGGGGYLYQDWTYTINEFDQLTNTNLHWSNGHKDIENYQYDARGSMTDSYRREYNRAFGEWEDTDGDGDVDTFVIDHWDYPHGAPYVDAEYTYDKAGYLNKTHEEVKDADGIVTTKNTYHYYNGMEQRTKKVVDKTTDEVTNYFYSGRIQLFTTDGNDAKMTENIVAPNGATIASQRFDGTYANKYFFVNTDIRNSTTAIIDNAYSAKKYYRYSAFGKTQEFGNSDFDNFITYTGAVSEGNDIFYMNARFYDANTTRFLSRDTYTGNAWEPWTQNLYSYCGNNPINMIDPTGHSPTEVMQPTVWQQIVQWGANIATSLSIVAVWGGAVLEPSIAGEAIATLYTAGAIDLMLSGTANFDTIAANFADSVDKTIDAVNSMSGNSGGGAQMPPNDPNEIEKYVRSIRNQNADFVNGRELYEHYKDHGMKDYASERGYLDAARSFFEKPIDDNTFTFISKGGSYFRWNALTNEFGIINEYGGISTYFQPDERFFYWIEQVAKYK